MRRIGDKMLKSIRNQNKNKKIVKHTLTRREYLDRKKLLKMGIRTEPEPTTAD